jgi:diguanylate cyclase (GGDEF)-like protein/PAS domain S-box-containing protein
VATFYYFEIDNKNKIETMKRIKIAESYNKSIQKYLKENYLMQLRVFVDDEIKSALHLRDRVKLKQLVMEIYNKVTLKDPYVQALHYHLPDGSSFFRAHNPEEYGDKIANERKYIASVHNDHTTIFGFEEGHFPLPLYRVVEPIFLEGEYIGAVEIGISPQKVLDFVSFFDNTQGAIAFYEAKEPIVFHDIVHATLLDIYLKNMLGRANYLKIIEVKNEIFRPYVFPIYGFYGHILGEFVFFDDMTDFYKDFYKNLQLVGGFSIFLLLLTFVLVRLLILRHEAIIHAAHLRMQAIINAQSDIVMVTNGRELIEANSRFLKFLHYENLNAFKKDYRCICELFIPGDGLISTYTENDLWTKYLLNNSNQENIAKIKLKGTIFTFRLYAKELNEREIVISMQDISELKNKEKTLRDYIELVDQNLLISSTDLDGNITYVSDALARVSGYSKEELLGKNHRTIKHPKTPRQLHKELWKTILNDKVWHGEMQNIKKDGGFFWSDATIYPRYNENGEKIGYTALRHDITDKKLLEKISITDGLTGLYNRRYFNEIMPKTINLLKRNNELIGFMIIDIDFFKNYNDTYGHQKGDFALVKVAKAINSSLKRAGDYAFRLGGEEFGVVFRTESRKKAVEFAQSICTNIEQLQIEHKKNIASPYVSVSIGVVCKEATGVKDTEMLYVQADSALYFSKKSGRNRVSFFDPSSFSSL